MSSFKKQFIDCNQMHLQENTTKDDYSSLLSSYCEDFNILNDTNNIFKFDYQKLKLEALDGNEKAYLKLLQLSEIMNKDNIEIIMNLFKSFTMLDAFYNSMNSKKNFKLSLHELYNVSINVSCVIYWLWKCDDIQSFQQNICTIN